jgi:hypothetical protein
MNDQRKRLKKRLDRLIQTLTKLKYKSCLVCGQPISCGHHYIQKSQSLWLRWDMRNIIPICSKCHTLHHKSGDPRIHQEILRKKGHKWADELEAERRIIFKNTLGNLKVVEEDLLNQIEALTKPMDDLLNY